MKIVLWIDDEHPSNVTGAEELHASYAVGDVLNWQNPRLKTHGTVEIIETDLHGPGDE